ncbi:twin-arginine translocase TatA/TatE family subunit [Stigmatella sp. ncwal1]|uniref:Sec-independent protein translocase protein TatA n=1 Tax=Stigmatella ashevillensis TaxID=2995309 RepID=A0ABT5D5X0_9BACT|nr:twin-arginine translocase TatA/TatE family subunit [Stigmatella ashevillena]MDC0708485.1 twin-arginine translocase TatA/TatE family subunit [Stigmatella ashevillena]
MGLKMSEILLIMGVLLLLFGASRLPQLGSSLGSAIRNFKRGFGGEGESAPEEKKTQNGALASTSTVEQNPSAKTPSHQG